MVGALHLPFADVHINDRPASENNRIRDSRFPSPVESAQEFPYLHYMGNHYIDSLAPGKVNVILDVKISLHI